MRTWRSDSPSTPRSLFQTLDNTRRALSHSGRVLFVFFSVLLALSALGLLYLLNASFLVAVPAHGGSVSEGIVGSPRFINPVLATSDADQDLTALVYSGLLKATPEGGYVPDLAESYTLSPDGKTYTFKLREGAKFQDGTPVTADDVLFTISKIQDPYLKSPELADWSGVDVEKADDYTVTVTLKQPYAPFIDNFTLGILPKHLWSAVSDDEFAYSSLNTSPVGSGPFSIGTIDRSASGIPVSYRLAAFARYIGGEPYLDSIHLYFYQNEDDLIAALKRGEVEAAGGISPEKIADSSPSILTAPLNRVFGVFFNQNQSEVLRDLQVRRALDEAVDRKALVDAVLGGYGAPLTGPLPPSIGNTASSSESSESLALKARAELLADGWQPGPDGVLQKAASGKSAKTERLAFTLTTGNVPELRAAAEFLRQAWQKMGASVTVAVFDQGDLTQSVIRPRKFDALLFGEVIGRQPDLYAFWDSSERLDPGLNIAQYANSSVDALVEELRSTQSDADKAPLYAKFESLLGADVPAVFLYAPDFVYTMPKDIKGVDLGFLETPSDRFLSVAQWHRQTDLVWRFLVDKKI